MSGRIGAAGIAALAVLAGCGGGGGGDGTGTSTPPAVDTSTPYPNSQVLGRVGAQFLRYVPAAGASAAQIRDAAGQATTLTAEYVPATPTGVRVACVSGNGSSIGVMRDLNPGVVSVSTAVLLDARWQDTPAEAAWAAAASRSESWRGWENCGIKPEGAPYPSSMVRPAADGSYAEDIYAGNPGTNFTTIRLPVAAADAAAMRGTSGFATTEDPARPLLITWRSYGDGAGHTIWVERGEPAAGAPAGTQGFITLFLPDP